MLRTTLASLALAGALLVLGAPARADECTDKAEQMKKAATTLIDTAEEQNKIMSQIDEGLARCQSGANNPWEGVDPRVNK
jgi:hypothetical protein